jgi:hypothetical protein
MKRVLYEHKHARWLKIESTEEGPDRWGKTQHKWWIEGYYSKDRGIGELVFVNNEDRDAPIFVVIVDYNTADSYTSDCGKYSVIDAFSTREKAEALVEIMETSDSEPFSYVNDFGETIKVGWSPWVGYFETINHTSVYKVNSL